MPPSILHTYYHTDVALNLLSLSLSLSLFPSVWFRSSVFSLSLFFFFFSLLVPGVDSLSFGLFLFFALFSLYFSSLILLPQLTNSSNLTSSLSYMAPG